MANVSIDRCTAAVTSLSCRLKAQELAIATGFFWAHGEGVHLLTNWHVVTGRHPLTGKHLSDHAGEPDRLLIDVFEGRDLNRRRTVELPILAADGAPLWREHSYWRSAVDVVSIPLGDWGGSVFALNETPTHKALRQVGTDVFVLGFPRGIGPDRHAIWKRASIASEPDVDVDGLPLRLIDTATAAGMSGAPAIQRFRGQATGEEGGIIMGIDGFRLLGVYSGRLAGQNEADVALGRVWKEPLVDEIIANGTDGSREPRGPMPPPYEFVDFKSLPKGVL
jgi:hypothetical protein